MKRERVDFRRMALPTPFVRLNAGDQSNLGHTFSPTVQRRGQTRSIFVIKQTVRLPSTNEAGTKIQRILVFDNHPDTLRLVFGRGSHPSIDPSGPQRVSSWQLIIVSIVIMGGLVGMFWPLL